MFTFIFPPFPPGCTWDRLLLPIRPPKMRSKWRVRQCFMNLGFLYIYIHIYYILGEGVVTCFRHAWNESIKPGRNRRCCQDSYQLKSLIAVYPPCHVITVVANLSGLWIIVIHPESTAVTSGILPWNGGLVLSTMNMRSYGIIGFSIWPSLDWDNIDWKN